MTSQLIRSLFQFNVTRDIPPVVYFHEQSPEKLQSEISEYIVTGGWPEEHPNHRRVPSGIHEQYVRLLTNIKSELERPGGPDLPTAWISGFYGSGKSSFAKLLGYALDGKPLPDGTSLAEAWLRRDTSPKAAELRKAWSALKAKIDPIAVVFDVGGRAKDGEHVHATAVREVQGRLDYCKNYALVADFELKLERDGEWKKFEKVAAEVLGKPWASVKDQQFAEEDFSLVLSKLYPDRYPDSMSWMTSRSSVNKRTDSPEEAVAAIGDMLRFRRKDATLFLVVDEVSQYVLANKDRVDRLRAFATALGAGLKGKVWLLALGQQKLDEEADDSFLIWAKDRFPPKLRVHLATTNIRDVVHKRLLQKKPEAEGILKSLFERHRPELKLYAYGCEDVTPDDFVEVYPMLPGQIDLILQITSALRSRSNRAQGDDQAIRGLLQLLGELFRDQKLADQPVGALVTLDQVYEVQHTALDHDTQESMGRVLNACAGEDDQLLVRAAKVVALLELIQETIPTDARLVAQCLYDRMDRGNQVQAVTDALEALRRRNLLGYSEKTGYKLQSSAGEEWEGERRDMPAPREARSEVVQEAFKWLMADPERPRLQGRPFPWAAVYSDGRRVENASLIDPRDDAAVKFDLRFLTLDGRADSHWVKRSAETDLYERIVWICGDTDHLEELARDLVKSRAMVKKYETRRESLNASRKLLLQQEQNRIEDLDKLVREAVADTWMAGHIYFRGRTIAPIEQGASFAAAMSAVGNRLLPELYPHFVPTQLQPSELMQLVTDKELTGLSPKLLSGELEIFEVDSGRYVPSCSGVVPRRVQEFIASEGGLGGSALLAHFGAPPYGYTTNVVKACVAGLLRAGQLRINPEGGAEITAVRDPGVLELFDKDRAFRRANFFPAGEDDIGRQGRARICKFFEDQLNLTLDREDHTIADAVSLQFPGLAERLRSVHALLNQLPGSPKGPSAFEKLGTALEQCVRICRQTKPTVKLTLKHLDALRDGVQLMRLYEAELTPTAIRAVQQAHNTLTFQIEQLREFGVDASNVEAAATRIEAQLKSERPWQDIAALEPDLEEVRQCYRAERQRVLGWQEEQVDAARSRLRAREGFATLTGEKAHRVVRPLTEVLTSTTDDAVAPTLSALRDPFQTRLGKAEEHANDLFDEIVSGGNNPLIQRVELRLQNRELATEAEVEALVTEIRNRLLEHIRSGARIRLV